ncbi:hypothetical protein [Nonomuraea candida]|uniref:hypothetical protein n=1 Tax=Nonomuraea candida TaxID=359159 RepID=UPI000694A1D6|nr:hypothetical protein [Nonomuraea candida]
MTRLLRETMDDWADEARVPPGLADRALRRRAWKPFGAAVLVAAMIAAVAVFVTGQRGPEPVVRPASGIMLPPRPSPAPTDVRTDTENAPPTRFIAAGRMAVSAYYVTRREKRPDGREQVRRVWSLYDPRTDGYERTPYAWVDVAPGLQVAAVLEGDLLGRRLGVLDLNTRQMLAWYDLEHPVGSVAWSPDGTRIVATAYSDFPDLLEGTGDQITQRRDGSPRTGYYLIDVPAGTTDYHELAPLPTMFTGEMDSDELEGNARQDLDWSLDGKLLWSPTNTRPDRVWYTLDGQRAQAPEGQTYVGYSRISAVSPDGRRVLGPDGLPTRITDAATGEVAGRQRVLQLHAWADDDNVIALGCAGTCQNEFRNGLVLVSVDGSRMTQLAANSDSDKEGAWRWVLTPR